jgi:TfoX/Sxy family transcriptional regulator of competence genes
MFQKPNVPANLSNLFGSIAAVTAKSYGISPGDLYKNGIMSQTLLDNVNYFRDNSNQVGYNKNNGIAPYQNNFLLGSKLQSQTQ